MIISSIDRENRRLVELALRCKLITPEQEKNILAKFVQELHIRPDVSVLNIFRDNNYLSPTDIDFLLAVQDHLYIKLLDKKFGMLAIANRLASSEGVEKALEIQANIFRETRENRLIGDILLANHDITLADRTAVLLTQDRIKDEFLADAINELAVSEQERLAINKRFGVIAVKKGYVNIKEINHALKQQRREVKQGNNRRYLGEILKEAFGLSEEDIMSILLEQKIYEKQRLNLEKALSQYISEFKMNQRLGQLFQYHVSSTKLKAFVLMESEIFEEISVLNLKNWIKLAGIKFGIVEDTAIHQFLSNGQVGDAFLIAQGYPQEEGKDGSLEFFFDMGDGSTEKDGEPLPVPFVKKGEVIAKRTPHVEGKPGRDVFGNAIPQNKVKSCLLGKGNGVESVDDISYIATIDGNPALYRDRTLFVTPLPLEPPLKIIEGDVEKDTGDEYKKYNLEILGSVCHGAAVQCKELRVWQNVLGRVVVAGCVDIKGMVGDGFSQVKGLTNVAVIEAQGNVVVSRNIENATIVTNGRVQAPGASVISSTILAQCGILLKNVCSGPAGVSTLRMGRHETGRMVEVTQLLDYKRKNLRTLKHQEELEGMPEELNYQIKVQEDYEERHKALGFLRSVLLKTDIEDLADLDGLLVASQADISFLRGSKAHDFIGKVVERFGLISQKQKHKAVQKLFEKYRGMFEAAVNTTQRLEASFQAVVAEIERSVAASRDEIDLLEKEINDLIIEKDFLLLEQEKGFQPFSPEIKIKNKIDQGTLIKGEHSSLVIEQVMYGVKLREMQQLNPGKTKIVIQGYFE